MIVIITVVVIVACLMGVMVLALFLLERRRDRLRAEKRRLEWMVEFAARGREVFSTSNHEFGTRAGLRKGGINDVPRGPKPPPPPPGRVVRDSMFPSFAPFHEATDAPARRLRRNPTRTGFPGQGYQPDSPPEGAGPASPPPRFP